ncbi:bactofilin family protein [Marinagarivorans algicola]|uniref:bactofilin family protein n=1 Tax=Marinagarivorans algicola TaxID=1513270 RepID=UPI0006B51454|nr:polymer-forming cytoskeletal protein [Marinagarivorans algicola]
MFGSKKTIDHGSNHTLISRGTRIVGDIHFAGELQIEGQVIGNVIAEGNNDARLVIADKGLVEGEVRAPSAVINGNVRGDVRSTKHLELASKSVIQGNVYYKIIEMVKGSQVNGNLVHFDETADNTNKVESIDVAKNKPASSAV